MRKEVQLIARVEPSIKSRLERHRKETGITFKAFIRMAILERLERVEMERPKPAE